MQIRRWLLAAIILHAVLCAVAKAQCEEWIPGGDGASDFLDVYTLVSVDHDDDGPLDPVLYAYGYRPEQQSSPLVAWRGRHWESTTLPLGTLFALDHAAAGGLTAGNLLIASRGLWAWNGSVLRTIGSTTPSDYSVQSVITMTTWDPDGSGPAEPWVIVAGEFTRFSGTLGANIVAWDGEVWFPLGPGLPNRVNKVVSIDPDGDGPALPLLAALDSTGQVLTWDHHDWLSLGTAFGSTSSLVVHDPDGPGVAVPRLYVSTYGLLSPAWIGWWNGSAWIESEPGFPGVGSRVSALASLDLDGDGPEHETLIAMGMFLSAAADGSRSSVAFLTTNGWRHSYGSPDFADGWSVYQAIHTAAVIDPDGHTGPRGVELIVGGRSGRLGGANGVQYGGIGAWNGARWRTLGDETVNDNNISFDTMASIHTFVRHDPDGPGPEQPAIFAAGDFRSAGGFLCDRLARWDGQRFIGLGTPQPNTFAISVLKSVDPDGPGGERPMLIGITTRAFPPTQALQWTGDAWHPMRDGAGNILDHVEIFDPDGDGPIEPVLLGTSPTNAHLLQYVGGNWHSVHYIGLNPLGNRLFLSHHGSPMSHLYLLAGNLPPHIWGIFSVLHSPAPGFLTYIDNAAFAPPLLAIWDRDGAGPANSELVLTATRVGLTQQMAFSWRNGQWSPLGNTSHNMLCFGLGQFDPDGIGPIAPKLFFGTSFFWYPMEKSIQCLTDQGWSNLHTRPTLNSTRFHFLRSYDYPAVRAFLTVDPDEDGPLPPELWVGGAFTHVAGQPSKNFARMRYSVNPPAFVQFPANAAGCVGIPLLIPTRVQGASQIEWHLKDPAAPGGWRTLTDGPLLLGGIDFGTIENTGTDTLSVIVSRDPGVLDVRCRLINSCHSFTSHEVRLTLCVADFNCSGGMPDDADVAAFFVAWNSGDSTADINASGGTPDDADVDAFFTRWQAGC